MPHTETITVFTLPELEGSARERALNWLAEGQTMDSFWHESVIDDAKAVGAMLGIDITNIFFSGFWSQGDGACFTGTYRYRKGAAAAVRAYAPEDTVLHGIADRLQDVQRRHFYRLTASVTQHTGHYSHEHSVTVDVDENNEEIAETLRDFMQWVYRRLEEEYTYLTSEPTLLELAEANEYVFDEDGRIVR